jgi:hypothetical protein
MKHNDKQTKRRKQKPKDKQTSRPEFKLKKKNKEPWRRNKNDKKRRLNNTKLIYTIKIKK